MPHSDDGNFPISVKERTYEKDAFRLSGFCVFFGFFGVGRRDGTKADDFWTRTGMDGGVFGWNDSICFSVREGVKNESKKIR